MLLYVILSQRYMEKREEREGKRTGEKRTGEPFD
jgi:hypothetical protein